jgi:hypothetical protein
MSETRIFEELLFKEINEPVAVHRHPAIAFTDFGFDAEMIHVADPPGEDSH